MVITYLTKITVLYSLLCCGGLFANGLNTTIDPKVRAVNSSMKKNMLIHEHIFLLSINKYPINSIQKISQEGEELSNEVESKLVKPTPEGSQNKKEDNLVISKPKISLDTITTDEKAIYDELGPIYQKIYLYAFSDEQRKRIIVYVSNGLTPYDAMNVILRVEERRQKRNFPQKRLSPAERAYHKRKPNREIMALPDPRNSELAAL